MSSLQNFETTRLQTDFVRRDCLHCGTALTGSQEQFCCHGCAAVYRYLKTSDLLGYYKTMSAVGELPEAQKNFTAQKSFASFDETSVRKLFEVEPGHVVFRLPAIKCVGCLWLLEHVLNKNPEVAKVEISILDKSAHVWLNNTDVKISKIAEELHLIGYEPQAGAAQTVDSQKQKQLIELGISGLLFANVMMFAAASYFGESSGISESFRTLFPWLSAGAGALALLWPGQRFLQNSLNSIRHRVLHIDLPITIALLVAYSVSLHNLLSGTSKTYFDSVTGLIFLLIAGRFVDSSLQDRAVAQLRAALPLLPEHALLCKAGDEIQCSAGDVVIADGRVISGESEIDESILTGESLPVPKKTGSIVYAGTQNLLSAFTYVVEKNANETTMAKIAKLIESARTRKSKSELLLARVLPWFLAGLTLVASVGFIIWLPHGFYTALEVFWTVLIVVCPCTIALSAPLSTALSLARIQRHGVLIKSGDTLERLAEVDTIISDKTGTLTAGAPKLTQTHIIYSALGHDGVLERIRKASKTSRHPLSKSITLGLQENCKNSNTAAKELLEIVSISEFPGRGLEMKSLRNSKNFVLRLGQPSWIQQLSPRISTLLNDNPSAEPNRMTAHTIHVYAAEINLDDSEVVGLVRFSLEDTLLPEARTAVERWSASGIEVYLASGDSVQSTQYVALQLGLAPENVHGGLTPQDKLSLIEKLSFEGRKVLMLGDGLNDAACLSAAHVGIAVRGAVDLALNSSDVYLKDSGLKQVNQLLRFSKFARRNLAWALALSMTYNLVALYFALTHQLHPLTAALIMPATSLTCFLLLAIRNGEKIWKS